MEAASGGHVEVARALLDHGAGVNTHSNDSKDSAYFAVLHFQETCVCVCVCVFA